jgi:hypothetical protein|tara:strand:- start:1244 stop:1597 length:354 start_codon:yes stop_codon:yes gene_type:complete
MKNGMIRVSLDRHLGRYSRNLRDLRNTKTYKYIGRVCIALSVLFNVITCGDSNQTFSARNHKWRREDKTNFCSIIDLFFFWHPEHCRQSWAYWRLRKTVSSEADEAIHILKQHKEIL